MSSLNAGCLLPGVLGSGWTPGPPALWAGLGAERADPSAQPGISLPGRGLGGRRAHAWPPLTRNLSAAERHSLMTASRCAALKSGSLRFRV